VACRSGGTAFTLRPLLSLGRPAFALFRRPRVLLRDRRNLRRAFALPLGLFVLLGGLDSVGLGFLAVSSGFVAKPFALTVPVLGRPSAREHHQRDQDQDGDRDDDNGDR
jgi:hypothetical protein